MPGVNINQHKAAMNYAMTAVEDRGDCFLLADLCKKG